MFVNLKGKKMIINQRQWMDTVKIHVIASLPQRPKQILKNEQTNQNHNFK